MKTIHCQCVLEKTSIYGDNEVKTQQTAWLPKRFAVVGSYLELKDNEGEWSDGWRVESLGVEMDTEEVRERSADYRKQRLGSDI